ncbi:flagellar hook-length control protein FliK [Halomonas sp. M20]|uniref:flagellar hook-length control protein FliK n=1 Tax=Halomonas sp. M20 TaxID=2763264 RepID=UPI001D0A8DFE|nr:flagellar hook-length control protein FliK [Halomonas sp. M20]
MSGVITPLLDTLLHQVLGKRVDTLANRELLEPVKPLTPGQAPRALHSDSRLHTEHSGVSLPGTGAKESRGQAGPLPHVATTPASTTTHFSPAARSIADILFKFPAPPSVIRSPAPLLAGSADQGVINAPVLASRLQSSIETSGLFYESHVGRWYRGKMSGAALLREPQMQAHSSNVAMANALMTKSGQSEGAASAGSLLIDRRSMPALLGAERWILTPLPAGAQPASPLAPLSPMQAALAFMTPQEVAQAFAQRGELLMGSGVNPGIDATQRAHANAMDGIDESLQGILRHQLELLVTPTLRWEGDLWSGVFMALVIQIPEQLAEHAKHGEDQEQERGEEDQEAVWHSQLKLELPRLGELEVQLHLRDTSIRLVLQSESVACTGMLNEERDALSERLVRCGFADVQVNVLTKVKGTKANFSGEETS